MTVHAVLPADGPDSVLIKPVSTSPYITLNSIADTYLTLDPAELHQIKQLRIKLQSYLDAHNTVQHLHQLAANSATIGHWRSQYHRNDLLALFNGINPGDVTDSTVLDATLLPAIPTDAEYAAQWPPAVDTISNHTLLRYLRARKGKLDAACEQLAKTLAWRLVYGADELGRLPVSPAHVLLRSLTSAIVHKQYDKHGRPIFMDCSGALDATLFTHLVTGPEIVISHVWQMEQIMRHCAISTAQRSQLVDKVVSIHNLHGTNFAHRHLLKYFNQCSYIDSSFYPETAATVYLINAPSLFSGMYNTFIKPFLDPVTAGKLKIFNHGPEWQHILTDELGADCIPTIYGGRCRCSDVVHEQDIVNSENNCFPPIIPMNAEQAKQYQPAAASSWW